jgi:hypothetical protein
MARVVIDAHLDSWEPQLHYAEGPLNAMRSAATQIASLLPPDIAGQILHVTGRRHLQTLDECIRGRPPASRSPVLRS